MFRVLFIPNHLVPPTQSVLDCLWLICVYCSPLPTTYMHTHTLLVQMSTPTHKQDVPELVWLTTSNFLTLAHTHTCTYAYAYTHLHPNVHTRHKHIHIHTHTYAHSHARTHTYLTHAHTFAYTHLHTCRTCKPWRTPSSWSSCFPTGCS
jgi:hypothetical protein